MEFSANVNTSKSNRVYAVQLINPYATADGMSLGWSLFRRDYKPNDLDLGKYNTASWGGGVNIGLPVSEFNHINFGLNAEHLHIQKNKHSPWYINDFIEAKGANNWTYTTSVSWAHNTLDSAFYPTSGVISSLGGEISIPPSNVKYYKLTASNKIFIPISKISSFMWNVDLGYGKSYGSDKDEGLPFYRNFYAGGVNSVRGYQTGSLSKRDNNNDSMGGNKRVVSNVELLFPVPGIKDDKSTRLSLFWDMGYVFSPGEKVTFSALRQSTGVAFTWMSPIGPIKLSYAWPLKPHRDDKLERFQLMLGTVF